jgi:hypothetical protein
VDTAAVLLESDAPFRREATTGLPAEASMTAIWACEMGSLGDPSYRSTERGITRRRFSSFLVLSKMEGLKRPCMG